MIQLIEKDGNIFHLKIKESEYFFIPPTYLTMGIYPIPTKVKGSTLGWNISGEFVSYNKIKKAIKSL